MTAQLEGIDSAQPSAPTPRAIVAHWFPAHVVLPDGTTKASVRVFVTDVGLYVFDSRPVADDDLAGALFFSPMNWPSTLVTYPKVPQPRIGFVLNTEAGPVAVTPMQGCGCHLRQLKNWVPSWSARSVAWGGGFVGA
jgi:hypothetical protein